MYPGLYSPEEIQMIAQQMTPGQVKTTRLDKIEAAFNKFLKRVQQNLHVIFSFSYTGKHMNTLNMHVIVDILMLNFIKVNSIKITAKILTQSGY
jgi:hypothetical protein